MSCLYPVQAFYSFDDYKRTGKKYIYHKSKRLGKNFDVSKVLDEVEIVRSCGNCVNCRLRKSKEKTVRALHESSLYEDNCFITLTYSNDNLPKDFSLDHTHFQKFMKRLRDRFEGRRIRYAMCGEYGSDEFTRRPHYHALLFNFDFPDKELFNVRRGNKVYVSKILSSLWKYGWSTIGSVEYDSIAYVSRYIMKKIGGKKCKDHYKFVHCVTGEICQVKPEYWKSSTHPGIGKGWFDKFKNDVFPSDEVIVSGRKLKPPSYYERLFERDNPDDYENVLLNRDKKFYDNYDKIMVNNTLERREARRICIEDKLKLKENDLDNIVFD